MIEWFDCEYTPDVVATKWQGSSLLLDLFNLTDLNFALYLLEQNFSSVNLGNLAFTEQDNTIENSSVNIGNLNNKSLSDNNLDTNNGVFEFNVNIGNLPINTNT